LKDRKDGETQVDKSLGFRKAGLLWQKMFDEIQGRHLYSAGSRLASTYRIHALDRNNLHI
jgi:hypothetical protein